MSEEEKKKRKEEANKDKIEKKKNVDEQEEVEKKKKKRKDPNKIERRRSQDEKEKERNDKNRKQEKKTKEKENKKNNRIKEVEEKEKEKNEEQNEKAAKKKNGTEKQKDTTEEEKMEKNQKTCKEKEKEKKNPTEPVEVPTNLSEEEMEEFVDDLLVKLGLRLPKSRTQKAVEDKHNKGHREPLQNPQPQAQEHEEAVNCTGDEGCECSNCFLPLKISSCFTLPQDTFSSLTSEEDEEATNNASMDDATTKTASISQDNQASHTTEEDVIGSSRSRVGQENSIVALPSMSPISISQNKQTLPTTEEGGAGNGSSSSVLDKQNSILVPASQTTSTSQNKHPQTTEVCASYGSSTSKQQRVIVANALPYCYTCQGHGWSLEDGHDTSIFRYHDRSLLEGHLYFGAVSCKYCGHCISDCKAFKSTHAQDSLSSKCPDSPTHHHAFSVWKCDPYTYLTSNMAGHLLIGRHFISNALDLQYMSTAILGYLLAIRALRNVHPWQSAMERCWKKLQEDGIVVEKDGLLIDVDGRVVTKAVMDVNGRQEDNSDGESVPSLTVSDVDEMEEEEMENVNKVPEEKTNDYSDPSFTVSDKNEKEEAEEEKMEKVNKAMMDGNDKLEDNNDGRSLPLLTVSDEDETDDEEEVENINKKMRKEKTDDDGDPSFTFSGKEEKEETEEEMENVNEKTQKQKTNEDSDPSYTASGEEEEEEEEEEEYWSRRKRKTDCTTSLPETKQKDNTTQRGNLDDILTPSQVPTEKHTITPANRCFLVVRLPSQECPEECPVCSMEMSPIHCTYNISTGVVTYICPSCHLTIYLLSDQNKGIVFQGYVENERKSCPKRRSVEN